MQKGEASNQKEMDAVLSAIDAVVLKLPEDVWGLDKLSPSQRMFITHQAGGKKNFQTTIQNRINMLFVSFHRRVQLSPQNASQRHPGHTATWRPLPSPPPLTPSPFFPCRNSTARER